MKKMLLLLAAAGAGYLVWRQVTEGREEHDLWSSVTDAFE